MELLEVHDHELEARLGVLRGKLRDMAPGYPEVVGRQGRLNLFRVPEPQLGLSPVV